MQRGFLADGVVRQRAAVLKLFSGDNQTLLIRRDTLVILDFGFHVVHAVVDLHVQGDRLLSQSLHEDLHSAEQAVD